MWIIPTPCEVTPFWETITETELFAMQKSTTETPGLWNNFVGTLQALFDVKQAPFRILLKSSSTRQVMIGDQSVMIAVGNGKKEIEDDWAWLESNVTGPARENGELKDMRLMTYKVCKLIEELVTSQGTKTDEITADERFRATARAFRQIFGLPESERLLNCTKCYIKLIF